MQLVGVGPFLFQLVLNLLMGYMLRLHCSVFIEIHNTRFRNGGINCAKHMRTEKQASTFLKIFNLYINPCDIYINIILGPLYIYVTTLSSLGK